MKGFALLVVLLVLFLPLVSRAEEEPVRLLLWQGFKYSEVGLLRENVAEFVRTWNSTRTPKIEIREAQVPFLDMVRKLRSAALARQVPDLAFVDANSMVPLAYGGVALALDTLKNFPAKDIDDLRQRYVPGTFDTNVITFRGERHLYGIPAQATSLALFWNRKMFREKADDLRAAGLDPERAPRDWDEFVRYGKVLTDSKRQTYGFGMNGSLWFTMPFLNQYGAEVVRRDADGRLVSMINSPRAAAALDRKANFYLSDGIEAGAWRDGALDPDQGFKNERYAMVLTGPWMIEGFRSSGLDFGVSLIPRVPLAEAKKLGLVPEDATEESTAAMALSAGNVGGQNAMISTASKHPEIALEFILFFTSERIQRRWAETQGEVPVLLAAQKGLDLSKFPEVPTFIDQINLAKPLPAIPYGSILEMEIFNPDFNLLMLRKATTQQVLENVERVMTARILQPVNEAEALARKERLAGGEK
jgi:ABC-type glycerol-3-phosphate transport system substrate-binding protein